MASPRRMGSSAAIVSLAVCLAAAGAARAAEPRPAAGTAGVSGPNILFVLSDDHAAHAVSAYGSRINQTPNIDRLARDGVLFRNCFAVNSICAPSRASILSGLYGHLNGVMTNRDTLRADVATFPQLLRKAGYATALIGKWHLKAQPEGFDHWCILPGQGAYFDPVMIEGGQQRRFPGYVSEVITDEAIRWLEQRDSGRPFCLLVHHKAPHADWEPAPRYAGLFADGRIPEPDTFNDDYASRGQAIRSHRLFVGPKLWELHYGKRFGEIPAEVPEEEVRSWVYQRFIQDYLRCVASVDASVGRLLDYVDAAGLSENTIVVYTSDQGFFLGDHGLYDKRFMYEESIRMPLLVRCPGITAPGAKVDSIVLNVDFAPTLLALAGVSPPKQMQGRSFAPLLCGEQPPDWRRAMYYRFYEEAFGVGPHEGVRTDRSKLIHYLYGDQGWELFDLEKDPQELHNVFGDPACAEVAAQLRGEIDRLRAQLQVEPVAQVKEVKEAGEETIETAGLQSPRKERDAPRERPPDEVSVVPEMEEALELDFLRDGKPWSQQDETHLGKDVALARAEWKKRIPQLKTLLTAERVRSMSRWAKEQMDQYAAVPALENVPLEPVGVDAQRGQLVLEGTIDTLPSHHPLVTRWLKVYVLYDLRSKSISHVTVTIRGQVLE